MTDTIALAKACGDAMVTKDNASSTPGIETDAITTARATLSMTMPGDYSNEDNQ